MCEKFTDDKLETQRYLCTKKRLKKLTIVVASFYVLKVESQDWRHKGSAEISSERGFIILGF
jgi:hypothetical protein